jgi:hypothetical protein
MAKAGLAAARRGHRLKASHWYLQAGAGLSLCVPGRTDPEPCEAVAFRSQFNRGGVLLSVGLGYSLRMY